MSLAQARAAYDARAWPDAVAAYEAAEHEGDLAADDLESWGMAAFLTGRLAAAAGLRERAHHAHLAEGDRDGAARTAFWLALTCTFRGEPARAAGWFSRMRAVLGDDFAGSLWEGYLLLSEAMRALHSGDADAALRLSAQALAVAQRYDDVDLLVLGGNGHGQALLASGDLAGGLGELDGVMLLAMGAPVNPQAVGVVYCAIVANCKECLDVDRSREWTRVLDEWCARQPGLVPFQGACIVHRSEMLQLGGEWDRALGELEGLIAHPGPNENTVGEALYLRAELHRLRGDHEAAEQGYRAALAAGKDPQPGLALMRAAQGRHDVALLALTRALEEHRPLQLTIRLLCALAEVALLAGDDAGAAAAAERIVALAAASDSRFLQAAAGLAEGRVAVHRGRAQEAVAALRPALERFTGAGSPYDVARCRIVLAAACEQLGDRETARLERDAARDALVRLGARADLDALEGRTRGDAHGLTPRECDILRRLATGATNREIAEDLVLSEKTVARHVANVFAKLGVSNRASATAYAFEHGLA